MRKKQSHSENHDKGEANAGKPLTKAEAKKAMARFECLARQLLTVPRDRLQDELERYKKRKRQRTPVK